MASFNAKTKLFSGPRLPKLYHPEIGIGQALLYQSLKFPDKIVLIDGATGSEMNFHQVTEMMKNVAENLMQLGLKLGDVAGFCVTNSVLLAPTLLGCLLIGVAVSTVSVGLQIEEICKIFEKTRPKIIFCDFDQVERIEKVLEALGSKVPIVVMKGDGKKNLNLAELLKKRQHLENHEKFDNFPQTFNTTSDKICAAILPSSGTTGYFKLARVTHAQLLESLHAFQTFSANSRFLSFLGFFHISGVATIIHSLLNLTTRIVSEQPFTAESCVTLIEKYKVTSVICFPDNINELVKYADKTSADLSSMKTILTGGYFVSDDLIKATETRLINCKVLPCFGMTEASMMVTKSSEDEVSSSLLGKLVHNTEARILMDDGSFGGINDIGELLVKRDFNILDYLDDEKQTKALIDSESFIHTGDCGYFNENLELVIVGRKKFIIRCCNHLVHPTELEEIIKTLPGVVDVCVVPVADDESYECPGAVVQKSSDTFLSENDVKNCLKHLEEHKQLKGGVLFVDSLPRTQTGKILRSSVEKLFYELRNGEA